MGRFVALLTVILAIAPPVRAYIGGPPGTLGHMCGWSTHGVVMRIERVDKAKAQIVYTKVRDLKGKWPTVTVAQNIAATPERQYILDWAEPGRIVVMFALESYRWSHTYIDGCWFASTTGDWKTWTMNHPEPLLLRWYSGRADKLASASAEILAGKEIVVPGMASEVVAELSARKAKVHRLRASLKITTHNPKEQFVAWGGDDFDTLRGMPGFIRSLDLARQDPDPQFISAVDLDGDGKLDLCLGGAQKLGLLQNFDTAVLPVPLPEKAGCRAAVWADYNGDGKPDLLLATADGPRLYTNLGGSFRDDTALLPTEASWNLTCAAWIDFDGDGKPDILLGNGFHGLRLYRNKGKADPTKPPAKPTWFEDVSEPMGLGPQGIGSDAKGDALLVADVNGDGRPDFFYAAGSGLLVLNTPQGFTVAKDCGIRCKMGKVAPAFGDFDGDGHLDLIVPQLDGRCKLYRNDGKGRFEDVTMQAGDLSRSLGQVTSAAWGDVDNDGQLDLILGCLRGPNRVLQNKGDGSFEDITESLGLHKRIFNTQAVSVMDFNNDGVLDLVFCNEGQDSILLLGNPDRVAKRTPLAVRIPGAAAPGTRVRLLDKDGKHIATQEIGQATGRGGQSAPVAHFAVEPGRYNLEARLSSGQIRSKAVVVGKVMQSLALQEGK